MTIWRNRPGDTERVHELVRGQRNQFYEEEMTDEEFNALTCEMSETWLGIHGAAGVRDSQGNLIVKNVRP